MHANVVVVKVEAGSADVAQKALHEDVIPRVSKSPGFVAGYWLEPVDGKGASLTLWESEDAAREAARAIQPPPMVSIESIETREVIGQA